MSGATIPKFHRRKEFLQMTVGTNAETNPVESIGLNTVIITQEFLAKWSSGGIMSTKPSCMFLLSVTGC